LSVTGEQLLLVSSRPSCSPAPSSPMGRLVSGAVRPIRHVATY